MNRRPFRIIRALTYVAFGLSGLTLLTLAYFSEPNGDDFCRARFIAFTNVPAGWFSASTSLEYAVGSWHHWTGRWASMLVETSLLSRTDLTQHYWFLIVACWGVIVPSLYALTSLVFEGRKQALFAALLLWMLSWAAMPSPGQALFWFTGLVENILPLSLVCVVIASLVRGCRSQGRWRAGLLSVAALGAILIPALHELHSLVLVAVLVCGGGLIALRERRFSGAWIACACLSLTSLLFVVIAPGNGVRASLAPRPDLRLATGIVLQQMLYYVPRWFLGVGLLGTTLAFVMRPEWQKHDATWVDRYLPGRVKHIVPAMTLALVLIGFAAPAVISSVETPARTLSGVYIVFVVGWFLTVYVFTQSAVPRASMTGARAIADCAMLMVGLSVLLEGNARVGLSDLKYGVGTWRTSVHERYALLRAMKGRDGALVIPRTATAPASYFAFDLAESPQYFRNKCTGGYFGLSSVAISGQAR